MNDVYYKIYYWDKIGKLTVLCMQWFDEYDYNQDKFFTDDEGNIMRFDDEEEAIEWLNNNVKAGKIDPEYLKVRHQRDSFLR